MIERRVVFPGVYGLLWESMHKIAICADEKIIRPLLGIKSDHFRIKFNVNSYSLYLNEEAKYDFFKESFFQGKFLMITLIISDGGSKICFEDFNESKHSQFVDLNNYSIKRVSVVSNPEIGYFFLKNKLFYNFPELDTYYNLISDKNKFYSKDSFPQLKSGVKSFEEILDSYQIKIKKYKRSRVFDDYVVRYVLVASIKNNVSYRYYAKSDIDVYLKTLFLLFEKELVAEYENNELRYPHEIDAYIHDTYFKEYTFDEMQSDYNLLTELIKRNAKLLYSRDNHYDFLKNHYLSEYNRYIDISKISTLISR